MEPKIYIDIVFPVTWGMDAFLLWMAGRILGLRRKRWRFAFGGLFAAVCDCAWLFFSQRSGGALFSLLLLAGGVFIAYTPKSGKIFLRLMGTTLLSSFLLGGGAQLLFTFTQAQRLFGQGLIVEQIYPWWLLPWAVLLAYVLLKLGAGWMETHICRRREFCTAAVFRQGRCAEVRTLIDTGNGLKQADDRGVAILEMQAVLPLFSAEEGVRLLSGSREGLEWLAFSSLGNPDGRLWGIRAEKLILFSGKKASAIGIFLSGLPRKRLLAVMRALCHPLYGRRIRNEGMEIFSFSCKIPSEPLDTGKEAGRGILYRGERCISAAAQAGGGAGASGATGRRGGCDGKSCSD